MELALKNKMIFFRIKMEGEHKREEGEKHKKENRRDNGNEDLKLRKK